MDILLVVFFISAVVSFFVFVFLYENPKYVNVGMIAVLILFLSLLMFSVRWTDLDLKKRAQKKQETIEYVKNNNCPIYDKNHELVSINAINLNHSEIEIDYERGTAYVR